MTIPLLMLKSGADFCDWILLGGRRVLRQRDWLAHQIAPKEIRHSTPNSSRHPAEMNFEPRAQAGIFPAQIKKVCLVPPISFIMQYLAPDFGKLFVQWGNRGRKKIRERPFYSFGRSRKRLWRSRLFGRSGVWSGNAFPKNESGRHVIGEKLF